MKKNKILRSFGKSILEKRQALGFTQMKLAEMVGCSLQHIGNVERGEVNTSILMAYRIAHALHVRAKDILP